MWSLTKMHWISLYTAHTHWTWGLFKLVHWTPPPLAPAPDMRPEHPTPSASDIWWPSLETRSLDSSLQLTSSDNWSNGYSWHKRVVRILLECFIITARKRSLRRLCFYTCLSFCPWWGVRGRVGGCVHGGGERAWWGACMADGVCMAGGHECHAHPAPGHYEIR